MERVVVGIDPGKHRLDDDRRPVDGTVDETDIHAPPEPSLRQQVDRSDEQRRLFYESDQLMDVIVADPRPELGALQHPAQFPQ